MITHFTRQSTVGGIQIYRDQYVEVDHVWLPVARTITAAEMRTRPLGLAEHRRTAFQRANRPSAP